MGGGQDKGLWDEEPSPFGVLGELIAVGLFLFGFDPSNGVEGEGEDLFVSQFSPAIVLSEDNLIAREGIIELVGSKRMFHLLIKCIINS